MTQIDTTIPEGHIESFLEMLYRHQEQQHIPAVNEDFLQRLSTLSEEDQYKAMGHILFITMITADGLRSQVYQKRLAELYKVWYKDQTEEWVNLYYQPPISQHYWEVETVKRKARHEAEEAAIPLEEAKKELGL